VVVFVGGVWVAISELESRVGGSHVVEQLIAVLTHERLLVIATDVVPRDTIAVHVVQHAQARLHRSVDVELCVVRLRYLLVTALAPRSVRPAFRCLVGGRYLAPGGRPEPSVHVLRLQVRTVLAALEVAKPTAGPDIRSIVCETYPNPVNKYVIGIMIIINYNTGYAQRDGRRVTDQCGVRVVINV